MKKRHLNYCRFGIEVIAILIVGISLFQINKQLQLMQEQLISAQKEAIQSMQASKALAAWERSNARLTANAAVSNYAEIWAAGNSGTDLDDLESIIYRNLIVDAHNTAFTRFRSLRLLGQKEAARVSAHDFAGFLSDTPAAREEWNEWRRQIRAYRKPFPPERERGSGRFESQVLADLDYFDQTR